MLKKNIFKMFTVSFAAVVLLTGCSNATIKDGGIQQGFNVKQLETSAVAEELLTSLEPTVLVKSDKEVIVVLYGSSSCLPLIEEVVDNGKQVAFIVQNYNNRPCTMDYAPLPMAVTYTGSNEFDFNERSFTSCSQGSCIRIPTAREE